MQIKSFVYIATTLLLFSLNKVDAGIFEVNRLLTSPEKLVVDLEWTKHWMGPREDSSPMVDSSTSQPFFMDITHSEYKVWWIGEMYITQPYDWDNQTLAGPEWAFEVALYGDSKYVLANIPQGTPLLSFWGNSSGEFTITGFKGSSYSVLPSAQDTIDLRFVFSRVPDSCSTLALSGVVAIGFLVLRRTLGCPTSA
jgi:hypothetical protein